jgi:hypothetical protein
MPLIRVLRVVSQRVSSDIMGNVYEKSRRRKERERHGAEKNGLTVS